MMSSARPCLKVSSERSPNLETLRRLTGQESTSNSTGSVKATAPCRQKHGSRNHLRANSSSSRAKNDSSEKALHTSTRSTREERSAITWEALRSGSTTRRMTCPEASSLNCQTSTGAVTGPNLNTIRASPMQQTRTDTIPSAARSARTRT